jgi:hypothetical protein
VLRTRRRARTEHCVGAYHPSSDGEHRRRSLVQVSRLVLQWSEASSRVLRREEMDRLLSCGARLATCRERMWGSDQKCRIRSWMVVSRQECRKSLIVCCELQSWVRAHERMRPGGSCVRYLDRGEKSVVESGFGGTRRLGGCSVLLVVGLLLRLLSWSFRRLWIAFAPRTDQCS